MKTTKKLFALFFFRKKSPLLKADKSAGIHPPLFSEKISMENKGTHLRSHAQSLSKPNLNRITSRPLTSLLMWCPDMVVLSNAEQMQVRKCKSEGLKVIHTLTHTNTHRETRSQRDTHPTRPTPNMTRTYHTPTTKFLLGSHIDTTLFSTSNTAYIVDDEEHFYIFFYKKAFDWCLNFIDKQAYLENIVSRCFSIFF